jgi:hypothetical protein
MTDERAPDSSENPFDELISEELEAVTFVRDYVQLQFGSPSTLNVYNPMTVRQGRSIERTGDADFANALIARIDKRVLAVTKHAGDKLVLHLDDDSIIEVSLRQEEYRGPEAFEYIGKDGDVLVE